MGYAELKREFNRATEDNMMWRQQSNLSADPLEKALKNDNSISLLEVQRENEFLKQRLAVQQ